MSDITRMEVAPGVTVSFCEAVIHGTRMVHLRLPKWLSDELNRQQFGEEPEETGLDWADEYLDLSAFGLTLKDIFDIVQGRDVETVRTLLATKTREIAGV